MENLLTAIDNCPGGARYGCAEEQMDRWIDTLTSAAQKLESEATSHAQLLLEAEVRHYRFACLGMEKEIAEYRLAEKERNELELAEIQETEKLHKENEELKDFSNWENHPALKHKVVLDDDFYLSHLYENELIEPDDYEKLKEENDVLQKFIAGNLDCVEEVKALISRDWNKEFIENNQERWEEVGLDWGSDDV